MRLPFPAMVILSLTTLTLVAAEPATWPELMSSAWQAQHAKPGNPGIKQSGWLATAPFANTDFIDNASQLTIPFVWFGPHRQAVFNLTEVLNVLIGQSGFDLVE